MSRVGKRSLSRLALAVVLAAAAAVGAPAQTGENSVAEHFTLRVRPGDPATLEGFFHFYNMRYAEAIVDFQTSLESHPQDPFAVNHLLEAVLFGELHREGKLDAQLYLTNQFVHFQEAPPDPQALEKIEKLRERATGLEAARLRRDPNDAAALYAQSVTRGLEATEQALVKKAWFAALRSGLGAYDDSKRVLELQPGDSNAKLIVGIYDYVVGSLPWPVKFAALLATIRGSRTRGLGLIGEAAASHSEASVDAKTTLALFLAREHHYDQSLPLITWLYRTFPHNFLYGLSQASLLEAAGKTDESIAAYRRLVELAKQGMFQDQKVALAGLNLGDALRGRRDWRGAAEAYEDAAAFPHEQPAVAAQARLDAGRMYDLQGERARAIERYREVLHATTEETLTRQARDGLKKPYRGK